MDTEPFAEPRKIAALMSGFERPWFIAGGWAVDLYLGRETRAHNDLDIAIFRRDQDAVRRYLTGWAFQKVISKQLVPWPEGEWLELPVHEIHAYREGSDPTHLEILLNELSGDEWLYRRNPEITRQLNLAVMQSSLGLPLLSPEIVLLYKSRHLLLEQPNQTDMGNDTSDLKSVLAALDAERRDWLRRAIGLCYLDHPWLPLLS